MVITKYHGLGNDFVIVKEKQVNNHDLQQLAITLCDRHTSVGADGLIVVKENPLEMVYYNSDGSRAKMCGNGIRCFAKFCYDEGIVSLHKFDVETLAGTMQLSLQSENPFQVEVNMGKPDFTTSRIPMNVDTPTFINQKIIVDNENYTVTSMLMGATHTTLEVQNLDEFDLIGVGKKIQSLELFPDSTNVNFYQIINASEVKMQTYERGAGLTLACGTGACSVYVALQQRSDFNDVMTIHLPLGKLIISKDTEGNILMTGPAEKVIEGNIEV